MDLTEGRNKKRGESIRVDRRHARQQGHKTAIFCDQITTKQGHALDPPNQINKTRQSRRYRDVSRQNSLRAWGSAPAGKNHNSGPIQVQMQIECPPEWHPELFAYCEYRRNLVTRSGARRSQLCRQTRHLPNIAVGTFCLHKVRFMPGGQAQPRPGLAALVC